MIKSDSVALYDDVSVGRERTVSVSALSDDEIRAIRQDQISSQSFREIPEENAGIVVKAVRNFVLLDVPLELVRQLVVSIAVGQREVILFVEQEERNFIAIINAS